MQYILVDKQVILILEAQATTVLRAGITGIF